MHENPQKPDRGMARSKYTAPQPKNIKPADVSPKLPEYRGLVNNGASFDDINSLSNLRKLQDSTKFDKARFSFRLYRR